VLLSQPQLGYRTCLEDAGVHGREVMRFIVDTTGHVEGASVVVEQSANTILDSLAITVSRGLVFRPARMGGSPVRMAVVLPLDFGTGAPAVTSTDSGVFSADCVDREPTVKAVHPVTYPEAMRKRGIVGEALVEFVVDTNGRAEPPSLRLVHATHSDFAPVARAAVASARFRPALLSGTAVRCRVRLPVVFQVARSGEHPPKTRERRPNELNPVVVTAWSRQVTEWSR
jgi:protein TonB